MVLCGCVGCTMGRGFLCGTRMGWCGLACGVGWLVVGYWKLWCLAGMGYRLVVPHAVFHAVGVRRTVLRGGWCLFVAGDGQNGMLWSM